MTVSRPSANCGGKERLYAIGVYPEVSLEEARAARDSVKSHLREGRDPLKARLVSRAEAATASDNTFAGVASDWLAKKRRDWSQIHNEKSKIALERDVLPAIGRLPVAEITPILPVTVSHFQPALTSRDPSKARNGRRAQAATAFASVVESWPALCREDWSPSQSRRRAARSSGTF